MSKRNIKRCDCGSRIKKAWGKISSCLNPAHDGIVAKAKNKKPEKKKKVGV